jgi:hypothetical protein
VTKQVEVLAKLTFNGFHVTYWNHETRMVEEQHFPTYDSVMDRGWRKAGEPFPSAETFAEDLFNVYGDHVGKVVDNAGNVLLDRMSEMQALEEEPHHY